MNILRLLFLAGAIQGFFTFLALFSFGRTHKKANYYLSFTVLTLTINMITDFLFHGNEPFSYPSHSNLHSLLAFTYGPLIYLYVRDLTGFPSPGVRRILWYFSPFFIALVYMALCYYPRINRILYPYFFILEILAMLNVLCFIGFSIRYLFLHERAIESSYSNLEKVSLIWLRLIIYSMAIIISAAVVLYFYRPYFDVIWLLVAILIYIMSYFTIRRPGVLSGLLEGGKMGKYQKSSLSTEMLQRNKKAIERCMEEEKVYLDNEITLPVLAEKTSIPMHHLSQIINQVYGKNFYEFISHYRIMAAKEMMLSPEYDEQKIIDICFRVGFNTISAFNKSFKKITGLTPTEYRNRK
ncbi:MAG: AraC family transcriptional regulator [Spirochaetes bacterium]|nr:AraC family transcriptional regulator [Spirochaetota bacterium]